ncbi:MAG TPA: flippase-like domain-containing protein [Solirubrobacteraceae bacterium]|nr:flippase-like domain-containing protein [Solirubrobacteraceae bacterium]
MPRVVLSRRRVIGFALFVASSVAFLYFVLPKIVGLHDSWGRISRGNVWWLVLAAVFEGLSFVGYVALFRAVFVSEGSRIGWRESGSRANAPETRIGWRESYEITMAGLAATRLFAAAGAGGVALTAWALRRSGMEPRLVACRMIAFLAILYGVYMATFVVDGVGLAAGLFPGSAPFAITVGPAIFGAVVIVLFLAVSLLPGDAERLVGRWTRGEGRRGRLARRLAAAPAATATGIRTAIALARSRDPHLLGAVAWWGFDIATLWACFHAFGGSPPTAVVVMAYFVGMLGNTLPLPAGIGGVDGGMIGAFSAFGVPVEVSVASVLGYRVFAFWLPTLPGAIAYLQLRRTVHRWQAAAESAPAETIT